MTMHPISNPWGGTGPARAVLAMICGVLLIRSPDARGAAPADTLCAGAARVDITPAQPVRLAGYASRTNLSQGVHDPLYARAVAWSLGSRELVLVSIDNLGFYNDTAAPLRQAILDRCPVDAAGLFLCAIHTHSAPELALDPAGGHATNNVAYTEWLRGRLVEVVRQALDRLQPAHLGTGSGASPVGVNRREIVEDTSGKSSVVLGRNPSALTDREVQVIDVAAPGPGKHLAVLFSYATHSTSLGPGNPLVSGDVHGIAAQFLERYLGADVVTAEFAGASGDIDPWVRVLPEFRTERGWIPETVLMGTLLGEETERVLERINPAESRGPIDARFDSVDLPAKPAEGGSTNPTSKFNITVGRVGEIAFVGLGGEVFNELGRTIKAKSPFPVTFVMTHCNGAAGYVPTRSSYDQGGYEVKSSRFAPGAGEQLVDETLQMLRELRDAPERK